jgi:NAD(P)-dependent dehydrogenase (short-subunit alcohol dehydrogenase family)
MKKSQWQDVIDLNLTGVFLCTQVVTPHLFPFCYHHYFVQSHCNIFFAGCNKSNDEEKEGMRCSSSN